jgi:hypothetical protein
MKDIKDTLLSTHPPLLLGLCPPPCLFFVRLWVYVDLSLRLPTLAETTCWNPYQFPPSPIFTVRVTYLRYPLALSPLLSVVVIPRSSTSSVSGTSLLIAFFDLPCLLRAVMAALNVLYCLGLVPKGRLLFRLVFLSLCLEISLREELARGSAQPLFSRSFFRWSAPGLGGP